MSQSGWIVAGLVGGFVVWLLINGKLTAYWSLLTAPQAAKASGSSSPAGIASNVAGTVSSALGGPVGGVASGISSAIADLGVQSIGAFFGAP